MVNPGSFTGSRKTFLTAQADLYAEAVVNNHIADTVSDIQRRYFKRYPISLPHNEEPSDEWLANVDDSAPEQDLEPPSRENLDAAAFDAALVVYNEQLKLIRARKEQIARRLKYQHTKAHGPPSKFQGGVEDPMFILMSKLTGIDPQKPRRKTGYNIWAPSSRPSLDALVKERAKESNISGRKKVGLRTQVYKEAYEELDVEEKSEWEAKAQAEYEQALAKIEAAVNGPASTTPEDRQMVIEGLPKFVQPVIDLIAEYTGWKVTLIAGGPEPADNGRLNMVSIHSGISSGTVPMNFGRSERGPYKQFVVPVFANFLKKCYTIEECRAAALPVKQKSLADMLNEDASGFEIHSTDDYIRLSGMSRPNMSSPATPGPSRRANKENEENSNLLYKIPAKVGPPIHAEKQTKASRSSTSMIYGHLPAQSPRIQSSIMPQAPLPTPPPAPLPPSRGPSPAPSRGASPLLSREISPPPPCESPMAPSRRVSPMPSHQSSPIPSRPLPLRAPSRTSAQAVPQDANVIDPSPTSPPVPVRKSTRKRARDLEADANGDESLRRRMRLRLEAMQDDLHDNDADDANNAAAKVSDKEVAIAPGNDADASETPSELSGTYPTAPSGCPDWFKKAVSMLCSKDLGNEWAALITFWVQFEAKSSYVEAGLLGNRGRPAFVAEWIRYARSETYRPKNVKPESFQKTFWAWWHGLQPEWRVDDGNGMLPRTDGDLEDLRKPGKNGLLSVLAVLFFWGLAAENTEGAGGEAYWKEAVDDVAWVMRGLLL